MDSKSLQRKHLVSNKFSSNPDHKEGLKTSLESPSVHDSSLSKARPKEQCLVLGCIRTDTFGDELYNRLKVKQREVFSCGDDDDESESERSGSNSQLFRILAGYHFLAQRRQSGDEEIVAEIMGRCFSPSVITTQVWEGFTFADHKIKIREGTESYGAVVWSSALVLCHFLETNVKSYNMVDKNVIEIGAGTGLVSIVASILGARVLATDLPELLGNLQYNIIKNTKTRCKHEPQVKELIWGVDLEKNFPRSSCCFDYILAADVVYHHPYLEELLQTFDHLCKDDTVIIWAMKFRQEKENQFVDKFKSLFHLEIMADFPSLSITLFKATRQRKVK